MMPRYWEKILPKTRHTLSIDVLNPNFGLIIQTNQLVEIQNDNQWCLSKSTQHRSATNLNKSHSKTKMVGNYFHQYRFVRCSHIHNTELILRLVPKQNNKKTTGYVHRICYKQSMQQHLQPIPHTTTKLQCAVSSTITSNFCDSVPKIVLCTN